MAGVYWKLGNHTKAIEHLKICRSLMPQDAEELKEIDYFIGKIMEYRNMKEKREIAK